MEDHVNVTTGSVASLEVSDVALQKLELLTRFRSNCGQNAVQIASAPGGEVINSDDRLPDLKQSFNQVAAYESGGASDKPLSRPWPTCCHLPPLQTPVMDTATDVPWING